VARVCSASWSRYCSSGKYLSFEVELATLDCAGRTGYRADLADQLHQLDVVGEAPVWAELFARGPEVLVEAQRADVEIELGRRGRGATGHQVFGESHHHLALGQQLKNAVRV